MPDLQYSTEALNAKSAFYRATSMVYVEGDDDVLFWEEIFKTVPDFAVEVESVGGSGELDKYIIQIDSGALDAIAARDADFLRFKGLLASTARVIYTFGYSMENSLYTPEVIHQLTRSWCKAPSITQAQCDTWLQQLGSNFASLIVLDIANEISDAGVSVLPDNCTRFMSSQTSAAPCVKKISAHEKSVAPAIPKTAIRRAKRLCATVPAGSVNNLRGHLLATAIVKFLLDTAKGLGKKIHVSMDSLYAIAISHFARLFPSTHPHFGYYSTATSAAADTFR